MPDYAGGAFVPGATYPATTSQSFTTPVISGATISGTVTVASGCTITTPTMTCTAQDLIATGATGSAAANVSAVYPVLVHCNSTGVSGAGINLGTATVGGCVEIINDMTGVLNVYSVGNTINGTTGTTAYAVTSTGNRSAFAMCTVAGAWLIRGNT